MSKPAKSKKTQNRLDVLHDVSLFAECMEDPEVRRALETVIIHRTYENNEVIMIEGDKADRLWIIVGGDDGVHEEVSGDTRQSPNVLLTGAESSTVDDVEIGRVSVKDCFGHIGLSLDLHKRVNTTSAIAVGQVETLVLMRDDFADLVGNGIIPQSMSEMIEAKAKEDFDEQRLRQNMNDNDND